MSGLRHGSRGSAGSHHPELTPPHSANSSDPTLALASLPFPSGAFRRPISSASSGPTFHLCPPPPHSAASVSTPTIRSANSTVGAAAGGASRRRRRRRALSRLPSHERFRSSRLQQQQQQQRLLAAAVAAAALMIPPLGMRSLHRLRHTWKLRSVQCLSKPRSVRWPRRAAAATSSGLERPFPHLCALASAPAQAALRTRSCPCRSQHIAAHARGRWTACFTVARPAARSHHAARTTRHRGSSARAGWCLSQMHRTSCTLRTAAHSFVRGSVGRRRAARYITQIRRFSALWTLWSSLACRRAVQACSADTRPTHIRADSYDRRQEVTGKLLVFQLTCPAPDRYAFCPSHLLCMCLIWKRLLLCACHRLFEHAFEHAWTSLKGRNHNDTSCR